MLYPMNRENNNAGQIMSKLLLEFDNLRRAVDNNDAVRVERIIAMKEELFNQLKQAMTQKIQKPD